MADSNPNKPPLIGSSGSHQRFSTVPQTAKEKFQKFKPGERPSELLHQSKKSKSDRELSVNQPNQHQLPTNPKHPNLSFDEVNEIIRLRFEENVSVKLIVERYKCSIGNIYKILSIHREQLKQPPLKQHSPPHHQHEYYQYKLWLEEQEQQRLTTALMTENPPTTAAAPQEPDKQ